MKAFVNGKPLTLTKLTKVSVGGPVTVEAFRFAVDLDGPADVQNRETKAGTEITCHYDNGKTRSAKFARREVVDGLAWYVCEVEA